MNYHQTSSSTDHSPYHYRLFWMSKHLAPQQKWLSEMISPFSHVRVELWGEAVEGTLCSGPSSGVSSARPSHNNTLWCLCSSGFASRCSSEGSQFLQADERAPRLMRHWWTRPTCVFQQAVPLRSQWSTVFPHTNTFYGEFRAPCSLNICFPKWFCYWGLLALIRAGSGLDHRLSTLLRSLLACCSALDCWRATEVMCCYDFGVRACPKIPPNCEEENPGVSVLTVRRWEQWQCPGWL